MKMNRDGAKAGRMDVWACTQQIMLKLCRSNSNIETLHKVLPSQVECWLLYTTPFSYVTKFMGTYSVGILKNKKLLHTV
jgi:hypothetical protein